MELHERTLNVGSRRLRYQGYRPADRIVHPPPDEPLAAAAAAAGRAAAPEPEAIVANPGGAFGAGAHLVPPSPPGHCPAPGPKHSFQPGQHLQRASPVPTPHQAFPAVAEQHTYGMPYPHMPCRRLSLSVKVPWSQPSALLQGGPGFEAGGGGGLLESLNEALASGSGYMVVGAAVRPGCILLQLDLMSTGARGQGQNRLRGAAAAEACGGGRGGGTSSSGGGDDDGGQLAARFAQHVGVVTPSPPADGELYVSFGGQSSYSFLYDALTAEWSAAQQQQQQQQQLGSSPREGEGEGGERSVPRALPRWLQGPYIVRLRSDCAAAVVPPAAVESAGLAAMAQPSGPVGQQVLHLNLLLQLPDGEATMWLAEQLRSLLLAGPVGQPPLPHGGTDGWHLVANCLGRSLPVTVRQVRGGAPHPGPRPQPPGR
jgi:hypothetical protein